MKNLVGRWKLVLAIFFVCISLGFAKYLSDLYASKSKLDIPTIDTIKESGYPINEFGQTYGPVLKSDIDEPELMLVENDDGKLGYILDDSTMLSTPEEAKSYQSKGYYVDMYLQDGRTKIGEFYINKGN